MLLEHITMPEFRQGLSKTRSVIVPFGSVEEHGAHLPLGTDTIHAYELAKEAARLRPLFVVPPVWYGLCRSTSQHPGTLSIKGTTLRLLAIDLCSSLYAQGLRNFVLISGHAGGTHMAAIVDAGEEILERLPESQVAALSILDLLARPEFQDIIECEGDSHAGEVETSLMMYLRPEEVKGTSPEEYPRFPKAILVRDKRRYWPGGVWGDPSKASSLKGKNILELEARVLIKIVEQLESINEGYQP